ncbi:unnamed protein product [Closterium sp. Naga37s-1]|nr:unnamed protein product [Closterium sp. Naga37s-1]
MLAASPAPAAALVGGLQVPSASLTTSAPARRIPPQRAPASHLPHPGRRIPPFLRRFAHACPPPLPPPGLPNPLSRFSPPPRYIAPALLSMLIVLVTRSCFPPLFPNVPPSPLFLPPFLNPTTNPSPRPPPRLSMYSPQQAACPPQHAGARGGARGGARACTGWLTGGELRGALTHSAALGGLSAPCCRRKAPRGAAKGGAVVCSAAAKPAFGRQMLVMVPPHPLIKHWIAILRNASSPPPIFRAALAELGRNIAYEATRDWLPMIQGEVATPCGVAEVEAVDPYKPIAIIPVLRAGAVMAEQMGPVIPHTITYHLGYVRDETTLQPTLYLNKLPKSFNPEARIIIVDAMLATGEWSTRCGTMMATMEEVVGRGANPDNIRIISAIVASPALKLLSEKYKGLRVYTGMIDADVNDQGFIVPGLGDAGDRSYGTL